MSTLQAPFKRKRGDHVVFVPGQNVFIYTCRHCGETFSMSIPVRVEIFVATSRAFNKCHIHCVKPDVEPVIDMPESGWIYVTERNPEADEQYLVSTTYNTDTYATTEHYNAKVGWSDKDVYAWRPLPETAPLPEVVPGYVKVAE